MFGCRLTASKLLPIHFLSAAHQWELQPVHIILMYQKNRTGISLYNACQQIPREKKNDCTTTEAKAIQLPPLRRSFTVQKLFKNTTRVVMLLSWQARCFITVNWFFFTLHIVKPSEISLLLECFCLRRISVFKNQTIFIFCRKE